MSECKHKIRYGEITELCTIDKMPHIRYDNHCFICGSTWKEIEFEKEKEILEQLDRSIYLTIHEEDVYRYDKNIKDAWHRGEKRFKEQLPK